MDDETLKDYTVDFIGEMLLCGFTRKQISDVFEQLSKFLLEEENNYEENTYTL